MIKVCRICEKEFETIYPNQVYCSEQCYTVAGQIMRAKRFKDTHTPREEVCCICGKIFKVDIYHVKFCSEECRNKYFQSKKKPEFIKKQCKICHKVFDTKSRTRVCCPDCTEEYTKQRKKDWYQEKSKERVKQEKYIRTIRIPDYVLKNLEKAAEYKRKSDDEIKVFGEWLDNTFKEHFDLNILRHKSTDEMTNTLSKIENGGEVNKKELEKIINIWYKKTVEKNKE